MQMRRRGDGHGIDAFGEQFARGVSKARQPASSVARARCSGKRIDDPDQGGIRQSPQHARMVGAHHARADNADSHPIPLTVASASHSKSSQISKVRRLSAASPWPLSRLAGRSEDTICCTPLPTRSGRLAPRIPLPRQMWHGITVDGVSGAAAEHGRGNDPQVAEEAVALHVAPSASASCSGVDMSIDSKLGDAGDAGPDGEHIAGAARRDHVGLIGQAGPRADQAHVAAQHVEQLRQLVELRASAGAGRSA